jgi:hypothetical protein
MDGRRTNPALALADPSVAKTDALRRTRDGFFLKLSYLIRM